MKVFGIVGWHNSGKTTLVSNLIPIMVKRGLSVSTVKHAHHNFDIDKPGKDSYEHRRAGAKEVLISSKSRWALIHENKETSELGLSDLLKKLVSVDLVLVEGFKHGSHKKLEVYRGQSDKAPLRHEDPEICAVASDIKLSGLSVPLFGINDYEVISDFIIRYLDLLAKSKDGPIN